MMLLTTISKQELVSAFILIPIFLLIAVFLICYQKQKLQGKIIGIEPPKGDDTFTQVVLLTEHGEKSCMVYTSALVMTKPGYYVGLQKRRLESIYSLDYVEGVHWWKYFNQDRGVSFILFWLHKWPFGYHHQTVYNNVYGALSSFSASHNYLIEFLPPHWTSCIEWTIIISLRDGTSIWRENQKMP